MEDIRFTKGVARYTADFSLQLPLSLFGQTYTIAGFALPSTLVEDAYWSDVNMLLSGGEDVSGSTITSTSGGDITRIGAATGFSSATDPIHGTVINMPVGHGGGLQLSRAQSIDQWISDWTFELQRQAKGVSS